MVRFLVREHGTKQREATGVYRKMVPYSAEEVLGVNQ